MLRLAFCALLLAGICSGQGASCGGENFCVRLTLCSNIDARSLRFNSGELSKCNDNEVCCPLKDIMEERENEQQSREDGDGPGCGSRNSRGVKGLMATNTSAPNSDETEFGEFPWTIAILRLVKMPEFVQITFHCGGSLIHPRAVLTAAHHVYLQQAENIRVRAGEWEPHYTTEPYPHEDKQVKEIIVHENFHRARLTNDIALLILESPYTLAPHINTICLPIGEIETTFETCFVAGWGTKVFKEFSFSDKLKKIDLKVHSRNQCNDMLRPSLSRFYSMHSTFICAGGEPGKDVCTGDGGSALMCPIPNNNNYYYQVGIVSWGVGCGQANVPGVYTNVGIFRRWIDRVLINRNILE